MKKVLVIGAGLAGSEAALFLAKRSIPVVLLESKGLQRTEAQSSDHLVELVCTNSLKSLSPTTGHGHLKWEMGRLGSSVLEMADLCRVPAGDALGRG